MILGIDLGTTNSLVCHLAGGQPHAIANAMGSVLTPSVVSLDDDDDTVLVGQAARERLVTHAGRTVGSFKRLMGTRQVVTLGRRQFTPEELSALVLRNLHADAEAALGQATRQAIISVPAYFNDQQRKATRVAGELAGLEVVRLVNEPTAAALMHGIHERDSDTRFLVFDLGGGTFDVSILDRFSGIMEVRATGGDSFLGGDDFTAAMVELIARKAGIDEPRRTAADVAPALLRAAESAKRALTAQGVASVALPPALGLADVAVSAEDYEKACASLLDRLRAPIERALRDARMRSSELDEVVLVGGATRMPMVRKLATQLFGRLPTRHPDPDQTIALGAAVCGGLVERDEAFEEMVLTDVCPHSLGTEVSESDGRGGHVAGIFMPVIERNTVVPASRVRSVVTVQDDQRELQVSIYQGESRQCSQNVHLGDIDLKIPPRKAGEVSANIRFTYDVNGLLDVDVDIEGEPITGNLLIRDLAGELSDDEIAERRRALATLKVHPREQDANRAVLERAGRLYSQLLADEREQVGRWIGRFEALLERQEPRAIAEARTQLAELLDAMEKGNVW